jgi:hypothetical protein
MTLRVYYIQVKNLTFKNMPLPDAPGVYGCHVTTSVQWNFFKIDWLKQTTKYVTPTHFNPISQGGCNPPPPPSQIFKMLKLTLYKLIPRLSDSSMIGLPLVIAVSEWDMSGIIPGPLGLETSALTNQL